MKKTLVAVAILFCSGMFSFAQSITPVTQVLVRVDPQPGRTVAQSDITLKANGKPQQLTGWSQVPPDQLQIAVLIDNNRPKKEVGDRLDSLRAFATSLPAGAQIYIGYMTEDGVQTEQSFTRDHDRAAAHFRRPSGVTEHSPGPFSCLSAFVKAWPLDPSRPFARFVLMLTDGVDYRPEFADAAVEDAQRAGVEVFAVYLNDHIPPTRWGSGGGPRSGDSPIDALEKVTAGTGGHAYYEWADRQPPLADYLDRFRSALAGTYVASFVAPSAGGKLLYLKVDTKLPGLKLAAPKATLPGNTEVSSVQ
jgi:hypothetical protein